jgi:uncharacterized protein YxjI
MQERLVSIGDDSWIEDDQGDRVYKVDGKAVRVRDTFILKDRDGNEVASIQEKKICRARAQSPDRSTDSCASACASGASGC